LDRAPDGLASALSFFSDEAFRYYLQAYLIADLSGALEYNDMVQKLTMGLTNEAKSELLNPIRYGARTWWDRSIYRYSVFTKEQVNAITAFLKYKLDSDDVIEPLQAELKKALDNYWMPRSRGEL